MAAVAKFTGARPNLISNRRLLARTAMQSSIEARLNAGATLYDPICVYGIAERLGVRVTFNTVNMEGMYQRGRPPRIHLSSLRPLQRRAYNCAHELGHHALGHGTTVDELRKNEGETPWNIPHEFMADTFAGFLLMPTLGMRNAFKRRGWSANSATPRQIYQVAAEFGVGYETLVNHLLYSLGALNHFQAQHLLKSSPHKIRAEILGHSTSNPLIVIDRKWISATVDAEVETKILVPHGAVLEGKNLVAISDHDDGILFEAVSPGISRMVISEDGGSLFIRVARKKYVGHAAYRHLEEAEDE